MLDNLLLLLVLWPTASDSLSVVIVLVLLLALMIIGFVLTWRALSGLDGFDIDEEEECQ